MTHAAQIDRDAHPVPRAVLRAAAVLVLTSLAAVGAARLTGVPPAAMPPLAVEESARLITIAGNGAGGVIVTDAGNGAVLADLDMMHAGFIAGVNRALARERMKRGAAQAAPVRLVRWEDGRLSLIDPETGWRAELAGFGPDNLNAFSRLIEPAVHANGGQP